MQVARFAMTPLDISDFPTRHNYGLALWQEHIERILAAWVEELAVPIYRGRDVTGFAQDDTGVDVALSDGGSLRAQYLVGCDGGRSLVRKQAGIDFPGWDPSVSYLIAEVEMTDEPALGHPPRRQGRQRPRQARGRQARARGVDRAAGPARRRADPRRSSRGARRRLRDRLRRSRRHVALAVHRCGPAGGVLPRATRAPRRRRGARAFAGRRTGTQHRRPGRREPGMEAGPGRPRHVAREPARHLPGRAAPGRCARAQDHHGADGAQPRRRPDDRLARDHVRAAARWTSRASDTPR